MKKIELGAKVEDSVSGFVGIATCEMKYLNGCIRYTVTGKQRKTDLDVPNMDVDIEQLKQIGRGVIKKKKVTNTGGPKGSVMRSSTY